MMNLTELKQKTASELIDIAGEMGVDGVARSRKQDVIFSILKAHAKKGEDISATSRIQVTYSEDGQIKQSLFNGLYRQIANKDR